MAATPPLCVDLDGTLIRSDSLWESLLICVKAEPWLIFVLPVWILSGRAAFKEKIAARAAVEASSYPYNQGLLALLRTAAEDGTSLVLVTAASERVAQSVAAHLGIFSRVLSSNGSQNLKGREKARVLVETFGLRGYDYAGDSSADLPVWLSARGAILAGRAARYRAQLEAAGCRVQVVPAGGRSFLRALIAEMRVYQWSKNLLIFLPLLLAHKLNDVTALIRCVYAFGAFSFAASAVYVVNDLLDLTADRRHPVKRNRPFATGDLPIPAGFALEAVLLSGAAGLAWLCGSIQLLIILALYLILSTSYSFRLKHLPMMDVMVLSGLYTSRIIAGGAAARVPVSTWLLAFSIFLFLSMALLKRVSEVTRLIAEGGSQRGARGYQLTDLDTITIIGVANGCMAALVLVLYMTSNEVRTLYRREQVLWVVSPVFLYWINDLWMKGRRGLVQEDPLLYCANDKTTWIVAAVVLTILLLASGRVW